MIFQNFAEKRVAGRQKNCPVESKMVHHNSPGPRPHRDRGAQQGRPERNGGGPAAGNLAQAFRGGALFAAALHLTGTAAGVPCSGRGHYLEIFITKCEQDSDLGMQEQKDLIDL